MEGRLCALIALALLGLGASKADVYIPDPNLKLAIQCTLGIADLLPEDMLALIYLSAPEMGIKDLTGLEYAVNLRALYLSWNKISDITPLAGLAGLEALDLNNNSCSDISPLADLAQLRYLNIHMNQVSDLSPLARLSRLETLVARLNLITDLSPLSGLTNLVELDLRNNLICDISPLANLPKLTELCLSGNRISDVSALAGLARLRTVWLSENQISDIGPLGGLTCLEYLYLAHNQITDISPLTGLRGLKALDLQANPLDEEAYFVHIPLITQQNPGIRCWYDPRLTRSLCIRSTAGGSVVQPGEGTFTYGDGTLVYLEARARPGFAFVGWKGTFNSLSQTAFIAMDQDHQVCACFVSLSDIIYVDGGLHNLFEDGSESNPFHSIQQAVEVAKDGAKVVVGPGLYTGGIQLGGRRIHVTGFDPAAGPPASYPVIQIEGAGPALSVASNPQATIEGFVISGASARCQAVIECIGSHLAILNCLLVGNRCLDPTGAVILSRDSNIMLARSTIADNVCGCAGAAIVIERSQASISDSIVCENQPAQVQADPTSPVTIQRSYIQGLFKGQMREDLVELQQAGSLFVRRGYWADPCQPLVPVDPTNLDAVWIPGDYHLVDDTWDIGGYSQPGVSD